MYEEIKEKLKQAVGEDTFNQLVTVIQKIETGIPTTKNHYGSYMSVLSQFTDKRVMATCLIVLGANKQGVIDALKFV